VQHAEEQQRDGPGEVEVPARAGQDLVDVTEAGADDGDAVVAGQQRLGTQEDDRVVVDVDDAGGRLTAWATSWVLGLVGRPLPMSRNWLTPAPARKRTARARKSRLAT
jgi:hypothetical protein